MMKIGIPLSKTAYTPEAYAYEQYLSSKGWQVQLDYELDPDNDVNIYFMGMRPFWKKYKGKAIEIHEYQSLSTPPYPHVKNYLKKVINKKPSGRIFLNEIVAQQFGFNDDIPYIYRDMGVDQAFFQKPRINPEFDIVYSGSIAGRIGLVENLIQLSKQYKIIVIGHVDDELKVLLHKHHITLTGRVQRHELPELYANARYGLNYTPDLYPFNVQTSTKTLEYLVSGLSIISNRYKWAEDFFKSIDYQPIWLYEDEICLDKLNQNSYNLVNFSWCSILDKSNLNYFLNSLLR
ncbi:glycosyl transferase [Acinetobacter variabilis]|uniref:glycosyl transferase n=1 Tax=Acinetobacter variabilis TaxID=70346 RepID=UPI002091C949|nr:glycosyl transferase [Acinetobacter variabilis]